VFLIYIRLSACRNEQERHADTGKDHQADYCYRHFQSHDYHSVSFIRYKIKVLKKGIAFN